MSLTVIWSAFLGVLAVIIVGLCVWRAISSARTPQGAVAWVIFLLAAPWFGVPAYMIFGHHKLHSYTESRRRSRRLISERLSAEPVSPDSANPDSRLYRFERLVRMPVVAGNDVRLLIDGEETFNAIFAAIDAAETYVLVQFYTIADDDLGNALADRLIAAAERGIKVRVICDGVGSYGLPRSYQQRLVENGVRFLDPGENRGPSSRRHINFRNHRKTVVIDGSIGFTGGHNVSDTYVGADSHFGHWRDTHLALRGPVVSQLQLGYAEDWHWASGDHITDDLMWAPEAEPANVEALTLLMGPSDEIDTGALFYFSAINAAQSRVWIASPYFVPDIDSLSALKAAALRGCDVRIMVPDVADHYLTWLAAFSFFDEIRAVGVKVYRYTKGFLHQKVVLIDDDVAAIGSANFDNRSFRLNFESMILVHSPEFAQDVARMLEDDMQDSYLLEKNLSAQKLYIRIGAPVARLLSPIL